MLFPPVPAAVAVTVTTALAEVAETPTVPPFLVIAAARFVALSARTLSIAKDVPVFVPLVPPLKVPAVQAKNPLVDVKVMLLVPQVLAVTVTPPLPLVVEVLVRPVPAGQALIAALRLLAKVVVLLLVAKVPAVELVHALEPSVPAVTVPHPKMPVLFVAPTLKVVKFPGVVVAAVTVLVLCIALTPAAAGHRAIAAWRFWARVVVLAEVAKVPVVELEQVFVPLLPLLVGLQVNPELGFVKVAAPGFTAVTVTVVPPLLLEVKPTAE
jgi:hypothetical protein